MRTQRRLGVAASCIVTGTGRCIIVGRGSVISPVFAFGTVLLTGDESLTRKEGKDKDESGESSRELHCVGGSENERQRLHRSWVGRKEGP